MWLTGSKSDSASLKDMLFNELYNECRLAAPGARLSYSCRTKLERFSKEERKELVSRMKEGCAPLFVSCKKGNVEIVDYLIEECGADVEQKGVYEVPDDRSIHYVTPLWCASVAGKLSVVKCLVKRGANVNSVSDTGSTPVRSACFMTHLDIVTFLVDSGADILKANYNGGTCLINSVQSVPLCEFLIKHGADVNAQDIQFKTALHYAIQEHRFETTKLLLSSGADPYVRSRYGDDSLQTSCLKVATQIFEYLIENFNYPNERIAEAYELLGSTFLDEHYDLQTALTYWRKALDIRESDPSNVIPKRNIVENNVAYGNVTEFVTRDELENMSIDLDSMRIQSLLICERILGPTHKDMIFRLMYRGAAYADALQYQRCIDLWKYALKLRIQKDSILHSEACFAAQALVRLFLDLLEKNASGTIRELLQYKDVVATIELIKNEFESDPSSGKLGALELLKVRPIFKRQHDNFDKILKILTHLFYVLNSISLNELEREGTRQIVSSILNLDPRNSFGDSLLHLVVSKSNTMKANGFLEDSHTIIFPDDRVTELLLKSGAVVDSVNHSDCTPLHVACTRSNYDDKVVQVLLHHGAHIDRKNLSGNQPQKLLSSISECTINPLNYISLKCLAARTIVDHKILFKGHIPVHLEEFIEVH